jgi:hypothetical protein
MTVHDQQSGDDDGGDDRENAQCLQTHVCRL